MKKLILFILITFVYSSFINANNDIDKLNLLFVGDIMGHSPQIKSAYNAATKSYDYTPCFKYVKPIIESADFAIGNLEVTLSDKGTYTGYPMFKSPDALATALKSAGFDLLVTSNNHSNDNGAYGVTHTIDVLDKLKFFHTGTFKNKEEKNLYYPLVAYKNGFKLAFLNYTYGMNGMPTIAPTLVNEIDETVIEADIKLAQKMKPDAIILIMHWGAEYQLNEAKTAQYNLAKKMFEWGASLVVGAHPHVIQPIKKIPYTDENGKEKTGLAVFSMGNFISNQQKPNTDGGLIVEIELNKKKGSNIATVADCKYIPVWRYKNRVNEKNPSGTYYVLPISAFENGQTADLTLTSTAKAQMKSFATRMRTHLQKHEGQERFITQKELKAKKSLSVGQSTTGKNPYAHLATYKGINEDTVRPRMIRPLENDAYIIHDNERPTYEREQPTEYEVKTTITPKPEGSTKGGDVTRTPPKKTQPTTVAPSKKSTTKSPLGNDTDKYLVQIQTTTSLYSEGLPFENLIVRELNGYFKYFIGAGNTLTEAKNILNDVHNLGFVDAFIIINNLKAEEAKNMDESQKNGEAKVYKIQFQSSTKVAVPQKLPVDDYEIFETEDGHFKYFAGKADTIPEAMALLKIIQAAGYKDAFIVPFVNGQPK